MDAKNAEIIAKFDRQCPQMTRGAMPLEAVQIGKMRGDLDLQKDGSQHRRYHVLYEDLLN